MLIGFHDDGVVQDEGGTVLYDYVDEIVALVIKQNEAVGIHGYDVDWDELTCYRVEQEIHIDDIKNYWPPGVDTERPNVSEGIKKFFIDTETSGPRFPIPTLAFSEQRGGVGRLMLSPNTGLPVYAVEIVHLHKGRPHYY